MKLAQIIDPLERATAAWSSGYRVKAIELLLDAWRACRDPQLADLIERLAPLPRDPWPTSDAERKLVVDPLLALPDDPRVASRLVSFLELSFAERPEALTLFDRVCRRIGGIRDVRHRTRLKAIGSMEGWFRDMLAELEIFRPTRLPSALLDAFGKSADDERIEARFLAQIYANPRDLELRAVWGDWLLTKGDPRGELVALQLANNTEPATLRELIETYGDEWAGSIGKSFGPEDRLFEAGMFAGGTLEVPIDDELLEDPAWVLVRKIVVAGDEEAASLVAALPRSRIATLGRIACSLVEELRSETLAELHVDRIRDLPPELPNLPRLRALALWGNTPIASWCASAPLVAKLDRIAIADAMPETLDALAQRTGPEVIELLADDDPWSVRLVRTKQPGPFTRVIASGSGPIAGLLAKLSRIPKSWPTEIEIDASPERTVAIDKQLATFPNAAIRAPWR